MALMIIILINAIIVPQLRQKYVLCKSDNLLFVGGNMAELIRKQGQSIFFEDIEPLQWAWDSRDSFNCIERAKPLMSGRFAYHHFHDGLSMHVENAVEQQNSCNTFVLQPGLSFTFILEGCIDVSFSGKSYQLKARKGKTACYAIVNNTSDVMSRKTTKGMLVKKLNIYVERDWLELRNVCNADAELLKEIFVQKKVIDWSLSASMEEKVERLMKMRGQLAYADKLELEYLTMQLLVQCINQLKKRVSLSSDVNSLGSADAVSVQLREHVERGINEHKSVIEIAAVLGMSERTLQRKFKQYYGETISSFIKAKRMQLAKQALLVEGKTIGETAFIAGYNHVSNFVSAFKKSFGVTPSEYLRAHR